MIRLKRAIIIYDILYKNCPVKKQKLYDQLNARLPFKVSKSTLEKDLHFMTAKMHIFIESTPYGYNLLQPVDIKDNIYEYIIRQNGIENGLK